MANDQSVKVAAIDGGSSASQSASTVKTSGGFTVDENTRLQIDQIKEARNDIINLRKELMVMVGIFASFITFLSVQLQLLQSVKNFWLLLGLSIFVLAGILLFAISLKTLALDQKNWWNPPTVIACILLLLSFVAFFVYWQSTSGSLPWPLRSLML